MHEDLTALLSDIMTAVTNCALYSDTHAAVYKYSDLAVRRIDGLIDREKGEFTVLCPGETMLINNIPIKDRSIFVNNFMKRLRRKGIDKVIIRAGLDAHEFKEFVKALASADMKIPTLPHIMVGVIEVRLKEGDGDAKNIIDANIEHIDVIEDGMKKSGRLDAVAIEQVIMNFISTIQREANVLKLLMPIKEHSEYTLAHSTNVAILTLFQAESVGFSGAFLREIGLAALMHDVGKMFVSREVLEKPGQLTRDEWAEMKMHPVYGARYLSTQPQVTGLAIIGAFEHHMRFDGTGYPDTLRRDRSQHLISQIISISDFFDALRTERPYRSPLGVDVVLGMMKESSGKDFNPLLVDNFIASLNAAGAA